MSRPWISSRLVRPRRRDLHRNRLIANLEPLEGRTLLATINWISPVDGNFNDPTKWVGDVVPGPGDDAVTPSGNYTIASPVSETVNSFQGNGALDVTGGTFSVTGALNAASSGVNNLSVAAGVSLHAGGNTTINGAGVISGNLDAGAGASLLLAGSTNAINLNAGNTLTGPGMFYIQSNVSINAATTAPTNVIFDSGNSFGMEGTGTFTVPSGATFEWRSGYMVGVGGSTVIASGGTLKIDGTSGKVLRDRALNNAGTGTWANSGNISIDQTAVFTNSGTFTAQNDASINQSATFASGSIVNTGTWIKTSVSGTGTTDIGVPFNNTGGTVVAQTGILQLDNAGTSAGSFNVPSASGTLWITGAGYSLNAGTAFTGPGTVHFTSGFFGGTHVNLNTSVTIPNLTIDAGTITGPGSLTVPGTLSILNGNISIAGTLTIPQGATLAMAGNSASQFGTGTFNNAGSATLSGSEQFDLNTGATFNNSGTFAIQDDSSGSLGSLFLDNNTFFVNTGTITKTSPIGTGTSNVTSDTFTNRGTISVLSGTLLLNVVGNSTGAFTVAQGAELDLTNNWTLNAGTTLTGPGVYANFSSVYGDGGTVIVNANISAPNFSLPLANLDVAPSATFTVSNLNWTGGQIEGTGTVAIPAGGTLSISGSSTKALTSATLSIAGTATWTGTGNINLGSGAVLFNRAGGTFNASNDQTINGGGTEAFNVAGTFIKTSLTGVGTTTIDPQINILPGGVIDLASGNLTTASLINVGTITLASQTVLTIFGTYVQPNAGTLNVAVGGAPATALFGQVNVSSTGFLNGTLNATLVNGFVPTVGQVFPIMTFSSRIGNFTTFNSPGNVGKPVFSTSLQPNAVNLVTSSILVLPTAPSGLAIFAADDTGGPGVTAIHKPRLTGQATPGILVQIYDQNQKLIASTITGSNGSFIATPFATLATGQYTFTAVAIDSNNNQSPGSTPLAVTITQPAAPTGLAIFAADDTGGPGITTNHKPRLTGQATPGILVQIYNQNQQFDGSGVADSNGMFIVPMMSPLATGKYTFFAVAIDQFGNYGTNSAPLAVTITPPAAPTGLAIFAADDTGGPGVTTNRKPRLTGQATPGILVQIYNQSQQLVSSAVAGSNGTFIATLTSALAPSQYTFFAVAIDQFGNYGTNSTPLVVTITPPAAPTGLAIFAADDTGGPGVTAIHKPRLTGQATPGILVQIYNQSQQLVSSAVAGSNGTFVATLTSALAPGQYTFFAVAIDQYGNYGFNSTPLAVTITPPPAAPTGLSIFPADDDRGPGNTTLTQPRLTGKAQAGLLVQIFDSSNKFIGSAIADSTGTFIATPIANFSIGIYVLKAVAIDAGNNYGASSTSFVLTIS